MPPNSTGFAAPCEYLSPDEFARTTGLSPSTVRRRLIDGALPYLQPGGPRSRVLIPRTALVIAEPLSPNPARSRQEVIRPRSGPRPHWQKRLGLT